MESSFCRITWTRECSPPPRLDLVGLHKSPVTFERHALNRAGLGPKLLRLIATSVRVGREPRVLLAYEST